MAEITLNKVSKSYNPGLFKRKVKAVNELSLSIESGEVFGLIGPNGAGKSSTIRMILGMSRPDSGSISFNGSPAAVSDFRRYVGYLPENPYLYDHLNLNELLKFCARVSGLSQKQWQHRGSYLIKKLGLEYACKRPLRTYSKGMMQRAGICFALLHDPSLIILDEPMSGLDPVGRKMVYDLVNELRDQGKTIFFCSHILSDVEKLCDRIGLMVQGELKRVICREELFAHSGNELHLTVPLLHEEARRALTPLIKSIYQEHKGYVITVDPQNISDVYRNIEAFDMKPSAIRSERISLEELFIQAVVQGKG